MLLFQRYILAAHGSLYDAHSLYIGGGASTDAFTVLKIAVLEARKHFIQLRQYIKKLAP